MTVPEAVRKAFEKYRVGRVFYANDLQADAARYCEKAADKYVGTIAWYLRRDLKGRYVRMDNRGKYKKTKGANCE